MWRLRSRVTWWTAENQVLQSHSKMINKCQNRQLLNMPRVNGLKKTDSWCWFLPTDKQNASVIFVCEGRINLPRQWLTFYCVTWTRLCGVVRFKAGIKSLFWQVSSISLVTRMSRILLICYWHNINGQGVWYFQFLFSSLTFLALQIDNINTSSNNLCSPRALSITL